MKAALFGDEEGVEIKWSRTFQGRWYASTYSLGKKQNAMESIRLVLGLQTQASETKLELSDVRQVYKRLEDFSMEDFFEYKLSRDFRNDDAV